MDFLQNIPEQTRQMVTKILNMEGLPVATKLELLGKTNLDPGSIAQIEGFLRESTGRENPVDPLQTPEPTETELENPVQEIVFAAELLTVTESEEKKNIQRDKSIFSRIVNVFNPFSTMSAGLSRFFDGFPKETNILLLGTEGCGKVEFINSFANYLKYANFDQALKNGPEVVIATDSIQLSRETEKAQVYSFMADGAQKSLRFIDSPDLIQNKPYWNTAHEKHLTNVLQFVKNFGQIHAILIFVRSDEEQIYSYTSYLDALFQNLHYQASKNIIVCFTSITKTAYRPDESAVKQFARFSFDFNTGYGRKIRVAENNTFCFENDSYRLLCAQKEGVPLSENAISVGRKHWTLSVQETFRLLGHIKTLTPFSNITVYTFCELMPVLSEFFYSRIVQIVVADEEIQKLEKDSIQQGSKKEEDLRALKERTDKSKRSFPKLVDFWVKVPACLHQNVLGYRAFFDDYLRDSLRKKEKTYINYLLRFGSQITLEEITAKELPSIEPYFAEESKEWKRILTEQQILSRPRSAKLITIKNDWYCNSHSWK